MGPRHVGGGKRLIRLAVGEAAPAAVRARASARRRSRSSAASRARNGSSTEPPATPPAPKSVESRPPNTFIDPASSRRRLEAVRDHLTDACQLGLVEYLSGRLRRGGAKDNGGRTIAIPLIAGRHTDLVLAGCLPRDPTAQLSVPADVIGGATQVRGIEQRAGRRVEPVVGVGA